MFIKRMRNKKINQIAHTVLVVDLQLVSTEVEAHGINHNKMELFQ